MQCPSMDDWQAEGFGEGFVVAFGFFAFYLKLQYYVSSGSKQLTYIYYAKGELCFSHL